MYDIRKYVNILSESYIQEDSRSYVLEFDGYTIGFESKADYDFVIKIFDLANEDYDEVLRVDTEEKVPANTFAKLSRIEMDDLKDETDDEWHDILHKTVDLIKKKIVKYTSLEKPTETSPSNEAFMYYDDMHGKSYVLKFENAKDKKWFDLIAEEAVYAEPELVPPNPSSNNKEYVVKDGMLYRDMADLLKEIEEELQKDNPDKDHLMEMSIEAYADITAILGIPLP